MRLRPCVIDEMGPTFPPVVYSARAPEVKVGIDASAKAIEGAGEVTLRGGVYKSERASEAVSPASQLTGRRRPSGFARLRRTRGIARVNDQTKPIFLKCSLKGEV